MTTVMLVDDHPIFRDGLRALLESAGMSVVAETATGEGALALQSTSPEVIVMDLGLPDIDGVEVTRRIVAADPDARVLVLTMFDDDTAIARALEAGARGYLVKDAPSAEVVRAVLAVAGGSLVFGAELAPRLARMVSGGGLRAMTPSVGDFPTLSERERQVLGLIRHGLGNAAIATRLGVSGKTVANYVSSVLTKLQVSDRAAAARMGREGA